MGENLGGEMNDLDVSDTYFELGHVFTPAAPVNRRDLFAGRTRQMTGVLDVVFQPGQHAVIFGERGVGKTSLTTVLVEVLGRTEKVLALRTNCDGTDNYSTIWQKVLAEANWKEEMEGIGFKPASRESVRSLAEMLPHDKAITPNDIRRVLQLLGHHATTVVFVDEFDRLQDISARGLFADTIKTLSDQLVPATIVLVGVADNVDELIAEHHSVERALVQIHMPRMSQDESAEIVNRGLGKVGMTVTALALRRITELSQGLPHYTHLLALWSARAAVREQRLSVELVDVEKAIMTALDGAQESIVNMYHRATLSARKSLYEEVLLACALARGDELGYFAAADVRSPFNAIMKKRYDIPAFAPHLHALSEPDRGPVLQKAGMSRKFRYRFLNPLLQPYVIMKGLKERMIDAQTLQRFAARA